MREEKCLTQWKTYRRQVAVPEHFTVDVMQWIDALGAVKNNEYPIGPLGRQSCLARWSAAGGLILLGLFRILYIMTHLLQPHLLLH
jgi:hypothetical protein